MGQADKRFEATPNKLRKAAEQGDVAKSRELSSSVGMAAGIGLLFGLGFGWSELPGLSEKLFSAGADLGSQLMLAYGLEALRLTLSVIWPILLGVFVVTGCIEAFQVGAHFRWRALKLDFSRLNPSEGLKRCFGAGRAERPFPLGILTQFGKSLLLIVAFSILALSVLLPAIDEAAHAVYSAPDGLLAVLLSQTKLLAYSAVALIFAFGLFDFWNARRQWRQRLRMDLEEIKREYRENEGSPELRGARKQLHQELALHAIVEGVRRAKVVVASKNRD